MAGIMRATGGDTINEFLEKIHVGSEGEILMSHQLRSAQYSYLTDYQESGDISKIDRLPLALQAIRINTFTGGEPWCPNGMRES